MGNEVADLKRVVGALIFGAGRPIGAREIRKCLVELAELEGGDGKIFAEIKDKDVHGAIMEIVYDLERTHPGFHLAEIAGGYRLQTDACCGPWLRHLLKTGRPQRLSQPALETLAIIAYRQPITKADIEGVRGVNVDHVIKMLMEMQLVRISGRSELPGRPFLYGTTHLFLEHFGLKSLDELADLEPMLAMARAQERARGAGAAPACATPDAGAAQPAPAADSPSPAADELPFAPEPPAAASDTAPAPGGDETGAPPTVEATDEAADGLPPEEPAEDEASASADDAAPDLTRDEGESA
jgi:segregation and condensation protein B